MGLPVAADARGIDESQPALQQRAGCADLDPQDFAATRLRRPAQVGVDVVDWDVDRGGFAVGPGGHDDPGRGLRAVADHRDHHGGLVISHSRHGQVEQSVEQLALALFELPSDHHTDLWIGDPLASTAQAPHQVIALVEFCDRDGVVDEFDNHADPTRVIGLGHRIAPLSRSLCISDHGMRINRRGPRRSPPVSRLRLRTRAGQPDRVTADRHAPAVCGSPEARDRTPRGSAARDAPAVRPARAVAVSPPVRAQPAECAPASASRRAARAH